ncbi:MAG: acyltransferase [Clostridium sp.]|nr:acyltransferase [Clostridium sp.]
MLNKLRSLVDKAIKRLVLKERCSSKTLVKHLNKIGCRVGEGTVFFRPNHVTIDTTRPWLIEIGKNVQITQDVTILTHGYDWSVIKGKYGDICGSAKKVVIGNNVFIGMKSTILGGVTIGDNVIIGANSLVCKDIPSDVVAAGNPARVIMTLEEYMEKRKREQDKEAKDLCIRYKLRYGKWPQKKVLREFIWLFEDRTTNVDENEIFTEIGSLVNNYAMTRKRFYETEGNYKNYDEFIEACEKELNGEYDI